MIVGPVAAPVRTTDEPRFVVTAISGAAPAVARLVMPIVLETLPGAVVVPVPLASRSRPARFTLGGDAILAVFSPPPAQRARGHHAGVLGWASFAAGSASFLPRAIVDTDASLRLGLSAATETMMVRALRIRLMRRRACHP